MRRLTLDGNNHNAIITRTLVDCTRSEPGQARPAKSSSGHPRNWEHLSIAEGQKRFWLGQGNRGHASIAKDQKSAESPQIRVGGDPRIWRIEERIRALGSGNDRV